MTYTQQATSRFSVASWEETVEIDIDGTGTSRGEAYYPDRGITRAQVGYTYTGEMEGTSRVAYVFAYNGADAPIFGLEQFTGSIGGQEGTCVLRHVGVHDATTVTARLEVVPGMGTGGLETLRGEADLRVAGEAADGYRLELAFDLG